MFIRVEDWFTVRVGRMGGLPYFLEGDIFCFFGKKFGHFLECRAPMGGILTPRLGPKRQPY